MLWLLFQAREGVQQVRESAVLLAGVSKAGLQAAQEGVPSQVNVCGLLHIFLLLVSLHSYFSRYYAVAGRPYYFIVVIIIAYIIYTPPAAAIVIIIIIIILN